MNSQTPTTRSNLFVLVRRAVLAIGLFACAVLGIFPPWCYDGSGPGVQALGHAPFWHPPEDWGDYAEIMYARLILYWVIVAALATSLILLFGALELVRSRLARFSVLNPRVWNVRYIIRGAAIVPLFIAVFTAPASQSPWVVLFVGFFTTGVIFLCTFAETVE